MFSFTQRTITNWVLVLFFLGLFVFEYIVFKQSATKYIIYNYPQLFDQGGYLASLYSHYRAISFSNLKDLLTLLPTGPLFLLQSLFITKFFGATRLSLLVINLVYFMLLQLTIFITVNKITKSITLGLFALALLLSLQYPFFTAGNLYDFRIDFIAFCCFGLYACFILQSNIFLKTRASLWSGCFAVFLIYFRTITVVYLFFLLFPFLSYLLYRYFRNKNDVENKLRIKNLFYHSIIIALFILPELYLNKDALFNYYVVGHITSSEKWIRLRNEGIHSTLSYLLYYPKQLQYLTLPRLLKKLFIIPPLYFTANILIFYFCKSLSVVNYLRQCKNNLYNIRWSIIFLITAILSILFILTLDKSKSPIVASIAIGPLVLLYCLLISIVYQGSLALFKKISACIIILFLIQSASSFWQRAEKHAYASPIDNQQNITQMYLDIGDYLLATQLQQKQVTFCNDAVVDYLTWANLLDLYYEQRHILLNVVPGAIGNSIFAEKLPLTASTLNSCDIFIINLYPYDEKTIQAYPFNEQITQLHQTTINQLNADRSILGEYEFNHSRYRVYVRK